MALNDLRPPSTAPEVAPETISSLLVDLQESAVNLYKAASNLDTHADTLIGSAPRPAYSTGSAEKVAAATILQKLRDLRRQFREVTEQLRDTGSRLDIQF